MKNAGQQIEKRIDILERQIEKVIDKLTEQLLVKDKIEFKKNRAANKTGGSNHRKHFYLVADLTKCGRCGTTLIGNYKHNHKVYYCLSKRGINNQRQFCGMKNINLYKLDNLVWVTLIDTLTKSARKSSGIHDS